MAKINCPVVNIVLFLYEINKQNTNISVYAEMKK